MARKPARPPTAKAGGDKASLRGPTVVAGPVTLAGRSITVSSAAPGGPDQVRYDVGDITRVQLLGISDATAPVVKVLLYILFGFGMILTGIAGLCAIEPQYNQAIDAAYHVDMGSGLPFTALFALMMYGAIGLNDRFKVVVITLTSGEKKELYWATTKAMLADATRLKDALIEAHAKLADSAEQPG